MKKTYGTHTTLSIVGDTNSFPFLDELQAHLQSINEDFCDGITMTVGFQDGAGEIVLTVSVSGLNPFMNLTQWFISKGFKDRLLGTTGMTQGCDSIFISESVIKPYEPV